MSPKRKSNYLESLIASAGALTTLAITPSYNLDPINIIKLLVLGSIGTACFSVLLFKINFLNSRKSPEIYLPILFVSIMGLSLIISKAPFQQQLYGVYGRNTGLYAYFALAMLFVLIAQVREKETLNRIYISFWFTLIIFVSYAFVQAINFDPILWNNKYASVIGTLGNPNFASAFMGMGTAFIFSYLYTNFSPINKVVAIVFLLILIFSILMSESIQGVLSTGISFVVVTLIYLHQKKNNRTFILSSAFAIVALFLGIFGMLGKGPTASFLYKESISYRGDYWRASFRMFKDHPLFGVGLDSYGDWYRNYRDLTSIKRRGTDIVTNSSHNVYLDILNTSGILCLILYILIIGIGIIYAIKSFKSENKFNFKLTAIFAAWISYLAQSLISINNLGLAVWGWIFPAYIIAYFKINSKVTSTFTKNSLEAPVANFGLLIGLIICIFPFSADHNFRASLRSGDGNRLVDAALRFPTNSQTLNYANVVLIENELHNEAYKLIKYSTQINPRNFDAWYMLNKSVVASNVEKLKAIKQMQILDPANNNVESVHR